MIRQPYVYFILIAISVTIAGCQGLTQVPGTDTAALDHEEQPNARAYYYFTVAQLKLKQGDINEAIWHLRQALSHNRKSAYLKLELANLLLIKKEDQESLKLVRQVLDSDPDNAKALTIAGRIFQQQNEMDKAVEVYERVLLGRPTDQGIYLMLGRIYWNNQNFKDAERVFKLMTLNIPDSYAAYFFYGKALAAQDKSTLAEKALLESIQLEPSLEEPRFELVNIYLSQNKHEEVSRMYQSILKLDPNNHNAALGLAEHYHNIDKDSQSIKVLSELGQRIKDDPVIISAVYERYLESKRYAEAVWALKGMLRKASRNSDLHYMAGIAYSGMEKNDQALIHMLKVSPDSRFYTNSVIHAAMIHHDQGKIDRAIKLVQKAIAHEPDNIDYYLYVGSFYEELERFDEALEALESGLEKDKRNDRLHFRLGVVYDKMGQKEKSIASMKNVLQLVPNDAEALNYLGYTYADMGINLDEAENLIQMALKIKPNDGYITDSLGWVYYKRGNYGQALEWLTKAADLVPDDPVILEHLGDVYLKMDSKEKALDFYKKSLKKKTTGLGPLEQKIRTLTHP